MKTFLLNTQGTSGKQMLITALIFLTLLSVIKAQPNTNFGTGTLPNNTTGGANSAFGYNTLLLNDVGHSNTAIGNEALSSNTEGMWNTSTGSRSLLANTSGNYNTANGEQAMNKNTTGSFNTATGGISLYWNTTGNNNTATGYLALGNNRTSNNNTAMGYASLYTNILGNNNTAVGYATLVSNSEGSNNTAIGDSAGCFSFGNGNLYLGKKAGFREAGNNKFYVANDTNQTLIYGDFSSGQLLMGKREPNGYSFIGNRTLNVLGGIITDSIRVAPSTDWADYVFDKEYKLLSFHDLERFIKTHKHLPNIPSASDVAAEGIDLVSINKKLLEKTEELHLYVLQLKKENELQTREVDLVKKQMERHITEMNELKLMLKKIVKNKSPD